MLIRPGIRCIYKIALALLGITALLTEIIVSQGRGLFNPANFFSYFTVENNLLAAIVLAISATYTFKGRQPAWLAHLRAAAATFMIIVGVGFAILLSELDGAVLTAVPIDNIVLHYIMPVAVLLDLVIDRPSVRLSFRSSLWWLLYPLAYAIYCIIRGHLTGWYPYAFLNVERHGYLQLIFISIGLFVIGGASIWLAARLSRKAASAS